MKDFSPININDVWIEFVEKRFLNDSLIQDLLRKAQIEKEPGEECLIIHLMSSATTDKERHVLLGLDWAELEKEAGDYIGMEINF